MITPRLVRAGLFVVATAIAATAGGAARAETPPPGNAAEAGAVSPASQGQGVAVLALAGAKNEAFTLARAIYASKVRPPALDEVRARVLAGAEPPANASSELRELAEVRASVNGSFDAPSRRLLAGLAAQVGARALLVVRVETPAPPAPPAAADADAGPVAGPAADAEAAATPAAPPPPAAPAKTVTARLLLVEGAELDAAQYSPDPDGSWRGTVASLERRFPAASSSRTVAGPAAATSIPASVPAEEKSKPFYLSGWFWGAVGAAALLGGAFFLASRDTSADSIHLEMRVPK